MDAEGRGPRTLTPILLIGLLLINAALLFGVGTGALSPGPRAAPRAVTPRGDLTASEKTTIAIFEQSSASVVHITALVDRRESIFSRDVRSIPEGTGTGFLWDSSGHIVTNFHVIAQADRAQVTLSDRSTWPAALVGADPDHDLAVLRIEAPGLGLKAIPIGTSADLRVGQATFAIGNPFGLDQTLTTGVVSALGRQIEAVNRRPIFGAIQTDAAINPGNSGGPLLDSAGRLIGVNTAIYSPSGASVGIGFAIPVDTVQRIVPALIAGREVKRPGLGIRPAEPQLTARLGLKGVLVLEVIPGSGAEQAGLRPTRRRRDGRIELGDVILAIDGKPIRDLDDLYETLDARKVGEAVTVTIQRGQERTELAVSLSAL